jgi:hypothetical protein
MPLHERVRPLRPMRIVFATDEGDYADDVIAAADALGVGVTVASTADDVETTVRRTGANVLVLDAEDDFAAAARVASAFVEAHPHVVVGVVATGVDDRRVGPFLVMHRWRSAERLVRELSRAYVHKTVATEPRSSIAP